MQTFNHTSQPEMELKSVVQPLEKSSMKGKKKTEYIMIGGVFVVLILLGIGTGYLLSNTGGKSGITSDATISTSGKKIFGSTDIKIFPDSAVGTIEKEGISGEGTHKLVREGGPSQTACLVSSVLDLDEFIGKQVKVQSKTMGAKKCPWLMDVGSIELQ